MIKSHSTALVAVARKVIILDYDDLAPMYIFATGVVLIATAIAYYGVHKIPDSTVEEDHAKKLL